VVIREMASKLPRPGSGPGYPDMSREARWAVVSALQRIAGHPVACQCLFAQGFMPLLRMALERYRSSNDALPRTAPRPRLPPPLVVSHDPPPFPGGAAAPALQRTCVTVKDRIMNTSFSLPLLSTMSGMSYASFAPGQTFGNFGQKTRPQDRTKDASFFESQSKDGGHDGVRKSGVNFITDGESSTIPPTASRRRMTSAAGADLSLVSSAAADSVEADFPSLMWLVGDDGVEPGSFYRACDRSFMILRLQRLLHTMEKVDFAAGALASRRNRLCTVNVTHGI